MLWHLAEVCAQPALGSHLQILICGSDQEGIAFDVFAAGNPSPLIADVPAVIDVQRVPPLLAILIAPGKLDKAVVTHRDVKPASLASERPPHCLQDPGLPVTPVVAVDRQKLERVRHCHLTARRPLKGRSSDGHYPRDPVIERDGLFFLRACPLDADGVFGKRPERRRIRPAIVADAQSPNSRLPGRRDGGTRILLCPHQWAQVPARASVSGDISWQPPLESGE